MTHPFFDAGVTRYPWSRPEGQRLYEALYQVYDNPVEIDRVYQQSAPGLPPIGLVGGPPLIWKEALETLTKHTGALQGLCNQQFTNARLQNAVREVINAVALTRRRIASDDVLILDRVSLREKVERVVAEAGVLKVLLVRGGAQSGKSWGRHVLHGAALDRGAVFVYITGGMVANVQHVVELLFSRLGAFDEIPQTYTTDIAGYMTICFKLQSVATARGKQLWIAVDDLGPGEDGVPLLSTEIKEFFDQFTLQMTDPSFAAWFRLMLIHYPEGKPPTKWRREVWVEDRPSEADVQQADVADVLREWVESRGRNMVEADLLGLAAEVIANAEAPLPPGEELESRLQRINDELRRTLDNLAQQP